MPACYRSNNTTRWIVLLTLVLMATMLTTTGCRKDKNVVDDRNAAELYRVSKRYMDNQSWARATSSYKMLQTRYPFGRYTEQSMLDLSYVQFKAGDSQSALSTLDRFIRTYPTHPNVDYAYYLKGLVNYEQNLGFLERMMPTRVRDRDQSSARDAFLDFSELLRRFPDSRYVPDARQRMVFLRNNLAAYEILVAEYYIRREAYIAAVNRARYVLEVYPNTPETVEALIILHKSYIELELPKLADTSWDLLALNYPDHDYVLGNKKKRDWFGWLWPFD